MGMQSKLDLPLKTKGKNEQSGFTPRTSATLIAIIAWLEFIIGVILILTALFQYKYGLNYLLIYIGGGLIVSCAYTFIIYNLATDVQALSYDTNIQMNNNNAYQDDVVKLLQEINDRLAYLEGNAQQIDQ